MRSSPASTSAGAILQYSLIVSPPGSRSSPLSRAHSNPLGPSSARIAAITSRGKRGGSSKLPPYSSVRWFVAGERNVFTRYPCAACSSSNWKPACTARRVASVWSCTIRAISSRVSSIGTAGIVGERDLDDDQPRPARCAGPVVLDVLSRRTAICIGIHGAHGRLHDAIAKRDAADADRKTQSRKQQRRTIVG